MILWTSDQPWQCEHAEPRVTCRLCAPRAAALTDALAIVVLIGAVTWFVAAAVWADDREHAATMRRAQPQIERVTR